MAKRTSKINSEFISEIIVHGIQEKKGNDIVSLDLRNLSGSVSDYFIICHAESTTQVRAIADSIEEEMFKATKETPWRKEGYANCEWIILDFVNVVVHVFQKEKRYFYGVEDLWGDADVKQFKTA